MDNEQPWLPPVPQTVSQHPKITPQVPDVTLFSPSNKLPNNNKQNFLQRAMASEKVLSNNPKQQSPTSVPANNVIFNNVKPSVPDLSLFEPRQVMNPTNRVSANCFANSRKSPTSTTMVFQKSNRSSKENVFEAVARPTVPDVTILDELPKKQTTQTTESNQVFSESYKKLLIKSHEHFMKQIKNDKEEITVKPLRKKSGLFNPQYQDNPLRKYAPKPQPSTYQNDANSSSILLECEDNSPPLPTPETDEKSDEMTFKKVALMLSEIQKLVIPEKTTVNDVQEENLKSPHKQYTILRHLASSFLTQDELEYYEVEKELNEMEKKGTDDS
jgi:hypothetical protein